MANQNATPKPYSVERSDMLAQAALFTLGLARSDALAAEMGSNGGVAFEFCDTATDEEQEAEIERKRVERVGS